MMLKDKERQADCIASDRVEGTAVYTRDGDKCGSVDCIMIEKVSGQARDAVLNVGGFLGIGGERHSIPWQKLEYDTDLGGYRLDVTEEELKGAPTFGEQDRERAYDRDYQTTVYEYWTVSPYW